MMNIKGRQKLHQNDTASWRNRTWGPRCCQLFPPIPLCSLSPPPFFLLKSQRIPECSACTSNRSRCLLKTNISTKKHHCCNFNLRPFISLMEHVAVEIYIKKQISRFFLSELFYYLVCFIHWHHYPTRKVLPWWTPAASAQHCLTPWVWRVCPRGEEGSGGDVGTTPSDTHQPAASPVCGHINRSRIANGANLSVICAGLIKNTCLLHNGSSVTPWSRAVSFVEAQAGWLSRKVSCVAFHASRV